MGSFNFPADKTSKNISQHRRVSLEWEHRRREMIEMRKSGSTLEEVGRRFGVCRQRIKEIELKEEKNYLGDESRESLLGINPETVNHCLVVFKLKEIKC